MKIGIVGYQGSGKSTLFHWLTGVAPDPALAHAAQSAMTQVPEPRVDGLCEIYKPKKITLASLELVDTPGLSRDHAGSAAKLALIRESGCLIVVIPSFSGVNPLAELRNFEDDLLIADLDLVSNRIERLREAVKKPRPNRDEQLAELAALEPLHAALDGGQALRELELTPEQSRAIRSFQLFTEKPRLILLNTSDDGQQVPAEVADNLPPKSEVRAASLTLQLELAQMDPAERADFCREMEVAEVDRAELLRTDHARLGADAVLHRGREGGPHLDDPPGLHRRGGGGRNPHRPGQGLHPRRHDELRRPAPPRQRARGESRQPDAAGAARLRDPGRRHPRNPPQLTSFGRAVFRPLAVYWVDASPLPSSPARPTR